VQISKIQISNFRSLHNLEVDLEEYLSIIVGKNNSGKTSLLLVLERFLGGSGNARFELDDFNIEFQMYLGDLIDGKIQPADPTAICGISLRLFIDYGVDDDLANVGNRVIMDLDPANRTIVLDFHYHLAQENLAAMRRDFIAHKAKKGAKAGNATDYLRDEHRRYFKNARRSVQFDHLTSSVVEDNYVDLIKENIPIDDIISFKRINARRSVSNRDSDRGLSTMSAKIYKAMSADSGDEEVFETFKDALKETDGQLDKIYANLFDEVIEDVRQFGGIREGDTQIKIKSALQHREMLEENTTVMYGHGHDLPILPESHNGLGYLNLISIIFEIKILLNEFKRGSAPRPADINLLFIEEPEAHTHPQMQAVFIKNIKNLVGHSIRNAHGISRPLQTILSTHSAHIVAESDFDDIKYFRKTGADTRSRSLKHLRKLYKDSGFPGHYKFLKQYLTLNRSQLFFADKAILVEGDTERILLPAMMRKMDQVDASRAWAIGEMPPLALLSQNISVIEVGAHSHIYEIFLDFIGVKTLIITDIDSAKEEEKEQKDGKIRQVRSAHEIDGATHTTNFALQFYHGMGPEIGYYIGLTVAQKTVLKDAANGNWAPHAHGQVMCVFQVAEADQAGNVYHARSFEDAFFHINRPFMRDATTADDETQKIGFPSLTDVHLRTYLNDHGSSFAMAENGIRKKPSFAIEILLNSETKSETISNAAGIKKDFAFEFSNWKTPIYIEEGLAWIKQG
jgi:putative ATP-dependent endonuclease of OLD family